MLWGVRFWERSRWSVTYRECQSYDWVWMIKSCLNRLVEVSLTSSPLLPLPLTDSWSRKYFQLQEVKRSKWRMSNSINACDYLDSRTIEQSLSSRRTESSSWWVTGWTLKWNLWFGPKLWLNNTREVGLNMSSRWEQLTLDFHLLLWLGTDEVECTDHSVKRSSREDRRRTTLNCTFPYQTMQIHLNSG